MTALHDFVRLACLAAACAVGLDAAAQSQPQARPAVDALREQFPASSIDSVSRADAALAATSGAKERVDKDYKAQTRACLKTILVNACIDDARKLQRKRLGDIDAVELEANRFKRHDKADRIEADRAKHAAERTTNAPTDAATRERNRKAYDDRQAEAARAASDRAKSDAKRVVAAGHAHRPAVKMAAPAPVGANASQREKNVASYTAHQKAAQEHQVELDRKLAEKTADRQRRADAKAAKAAKDAATAAANTPASRPAALPSVAGPKP